MARRIRVDYADAADRVAARGNERKAICRDDDPFDARKQAWNALTESDLKSIYHASWVKRCVWVESV